MSTFLVTGASSGIGRGVAERLSSSHEVFGAARRVGMIPEGVDPVAMDLADSSSVDRAMTALLHRSPRIDTLVNCAGYGDFAPVELTSDSDALRQLQVNVVGLTEVARRVLPAMRASGGGRIVMVSSVAAAFSSPMGGWYHAGKAALESVTSALRLEVAPFGVEVGIVQPGPVRTDWHERALSGLRTRTRGTAYESMADGVARFHESTETSPMMSDLEMVVDAVVRAATDVRPRTHYPVGRGSRASLALGRLAPTRLFDAMTRRQFGLTPSR